jgi:hypothetical protein
MRGGQSKAAGYVQRQERFHSDNELSAAITRLRSQRGHSEASGVIVTWHGPWSYTLELSQQIPPGLVYECVAPEQLNC